MLDAERTERSTRLFGPPNVRAPLGNASAPQFEIHHMRQSSLFAFFPKPVAAMTPAPKKPTIAATVAAPAPPPPLSAAARSIAVARATATKGDSAISSLLLQSVAAPRRADAVLIDAAESPPIVAETRHAFVPAPEGKIADEAGGVKGPSKALSAYERKRNARIARNKMVLANLGLESTKAEMEQERAPKRRRVRTKPPRAKARDAPPPQRRQPSRRSSRVRGIAAAASASSGGPDPVSESESEPEP